mmetsp:Transcript_15419/g.35428  ORF Transcript_15419/g.35428 Transcript_15419/m.35428 type:complete len:89 (+) Transcript_15419:202-468(+)
MGVFGLAKWIRQYFDQPTNTRSFQEAQTSATSAQSTIVTPTVMAVGRESHCGSKRYQLSTPSGTSGMEGFVICKQSLPSHNKIHQKYR